MSDALNILNNLDLPQLKVLQGYIEKQIQLKTNSLLENLPNTLDLNIPSYVLITYVELVYIAFIEELFSNRDKDEDFHASDPSEWDDNNSIKVTSPYNKLDLKDGQYPKVVVQADGSSLMKQFIGNASPYQNTIGSKVQEKKSSYFSVPVTIQVFTQNYHQANILGNMIQMSIIQSQDIIRNIFGFETVTAPNMGAARKVREYDDVFMTSINFTVNKYVQWSHILSIRNPKTLILRLVAKVNNDDNDKSIKHILKIINDDLNLEGV